MHFLNEQGQPFGVTAADGDGSSRRVYIAFSQAHGWWCSWVTADPTLCCPFSVSLTTFTWSSVVFKSWASEVHRQGCHFSLFFPQSLLPLPVASPPFPSRPCFFSWHSLSPLPFVCSVSSHGQHQPVRTLHLISACSEDYVKCYPLACTVLLSLHHSSVQWALVYSQFTGEEATYCRIRKLECSGGFQASELSSCTCGVCTSIAGNIWQ